MNTSIVMTLGYNTGIGFAVPMYWLKLAVEDIVLTNRLLRRGEGNNVEGENVGRTFPGQMGMDLVYKRGGGGGVWKSHRYLSEV